jgi:hypothetical protein
MKEQVRAQRIDPALLPEPITRYLTAHRDHDTATAIGTFAADAVVTDDGSSFTGTARVERWLDRSSTEYTYSIELTAAHQVDDARYTVVNHLAGDFPGGQVDLRYRFTICDGLIVELAIEP